MIVQPGLHQFFLMGFDPYDLLRGKTELGRCQVAVDPGIDHRIKAEFHPQVGSELFHQVQLMGVEGQQHGLQLQRQPAFQDLPDATQTAIK